MKRLWHVATLLVFIGVSSPALPWGAEGHKAVGAIADALLAGHPAAQKGRDVLGFDLQEAGLWADCIRRDDGYGTESETHISSASAVMLKKRNLAVTGWSREMYPTKRGHAFAK